MTSRESQTELDEQRRLQRALRGALHRAPDLQPTPEFSGRLRELLRTQAPRERATATRMSRRSWLGLAAALVLAAGLTGRLLIDRQDASMETLAEDAIGDHEVCALKLRPLMPGTPPEASAKFNEAYRMLITAPLDDTHTPGGPIRVVERHACAYDGRRFGHVVMQYQGHVVSLLVTTPDATPDDMTPQRIGQANGLSVMSVSGSGYAVLMVSDLGSDELRQLSTIIAQPLAQRLQGRARPTNGDLVMALESALPLR